MTAGNISIKRVYWLDWVKTFSILALLFYHAGNLAIFQNMPGLTMPLKIIDSLVMPLFFLVSGMNNVKQGGLWGYYARRLKKLVPLLVLGVCVLNLFICRGALDNLAGYFQDYAFIWSAAWFDSVYWFLWYLIMLILAAGLIGRIKNQYIGLAVIGVVLVAVNLLKIPQFNSRFDLYYYSIFFFAGYLIEKHGQVTGRLHFDWRGWDTLRQAGLWVYMLHLPVIVNLAAYLKDFDLAAGVKLAAIVAGTLIICLGTYALKNKLAAAVLNIQQ